MCESKVMKMNKKEKLDNMYVKRMEFFKLPM